MQKFYEATKRVFGAQKRSILPVRGLDGVLIKEGIGIKERCAEHFCTLLNHNNINDHTILQELPSLRPCRYYMITACAPLKEEVTKAIATLKMNKTAGEDAIQDELLKYGGVQLHTKLHHIISWKDANLIAINKNKGDRADCGASQSQCSRKSISQSHLTQNCSQHN